MSIFRLFELLVFIAQKGVFSFQNIVKDIFLAYVARKTKVGKMSIFRLFELLLFIAQKGVFSVQNIVKNIFLADIAKKKKKVAKMVIFGPKAWVKPFGKMSIFGLFELLVFIAYKSVFWFQNIVKDIFLAYIA